MPSSIYLDHNATTPLLAEVWDAMRPYAVEAFGNPASVHQFSRAPRQALEDARERVAELLDCYADEVIFTSGATEANNLAVFGQCGEAPGNILASPIEHPSVIEPVRQLEVQGFDVLWLPVTETGHVVLEKSWGTVRLAVLMLANHETGAIQPVAELAGRLASAEQMPSRSKDRGYPPPVLHCDATQAVGRIPVSFRRLGVTSLAFSAHKFYGPKGIGALLLRGGAILRPHLLGGHQQRGRRPGTEPVHLVVGLAKALELACKEMEQRWLAVNRLRERFLDRLAAAGVEFEINGPAAGAGSCPTDSEGLPHTLNVSFPGRKADGLLMALDLAGVACATGSACSSGSLLPSPVLQAMRVPAARLHSALRFSLGYQLTQDDIDEAVHRIASVVCRLGAAQADDQERC